MTAKKKKEIPSLTPAQYKRKVARSQKALDAAYKKSNKERNERIGKEMNEIATLLAKFNLRLSGYDPGVTAYFIQSESKLDTGFGGIMGAEGRGYWGEPFSFNRTEWQWLKPLLEELLAARERLAEQDRQLDVLHEAEIDRIRR